MVAQRGDLDVVSEPFSAAYYDGPEARSPRFACTDPRATFDHVRKALLDRAAARPTFVKDMAYQALPAADDDLLNGCRHTFLVRDPRWSLVSMAKRWPAFGDDEAGFTAVSELLERVEATGEPPIVIDADDLRRDPGGMVKAWCAATGLSFEPSALSWQPELVQGWERWQEWHGSTAASTGFLPPDTEPPLVTDGWLQGAIDRALPVYGELRRRRLLPASPG
jgi:hypothetical protein